MPMFHRFIAATGFVLLLAAAVPGEAAPASVRIEAPATALPVDGWRHRGHGRPHWGPPRGHYGPPRGYYYAPPQVYVAPPPRYYYAPPPRYYHSPPPAVGLYFRF